jgi:threonine dehydratase
VQLSSAQREAGVVAFSSGNHAQGVALAAQLLEVRATIVMPSDAPRSKVAATRNYGAEIVWYDRLREDRAAIAEELARERGAILIPPFDDAAIVAGAGTAALELLEDVPDLEALVIPVGGGGLLAGSLLAARALRGGIDVWGVEPEAGDDFRRSLAAGERIAIDVPATIADGLQTTMPGRLTFPLVQNLGARLVTVSDEELRAAMRFAFERLKLVLEPSGGAALAAILHERVEVRGHRVGAILSGGNVDSGTFAALLAG